jgi:hypothetical protein
MAKSDADPARALEKAKAKLFDRRRRQNEAERRRK